MSEVSSSNFRSYVQELRTFNLRAIADGGSLEPVMEHALGHLDGRASRALRASVNIEELRKLGAFFTGERLARDAAGGLRGVGSSSVVVDPSCGCGDLLLAVAARLPVDRRLEVTLRGWGRVLHGTDIELEFVEATRQRLALLALLRGARPMRRNINLAALLPGISVGDGLHSSHLLERATHVLLNPPYGQVHVPKPCGWGSGRTTAAAVWIDHVLQHVRSGCQVVAILPDVLRSGSRYRAWRLMVQSSATVSSITARGQFDALTDIDVFLLVCRRALNQRYRHWPMPDYGSEGLGSICTVSVGPVVPHRDLEVGPLVPYITARRLPLSGEYAVKCERRYDRRLFSPPFVVIRRTSRPTASSDHPRLDPVVVTSARPVAVENHLLVLTPHHATLAACHELASTLIEPAVTAWLNERIRCRHLTVSAVRELPLHALRRYAQPS